MCLWDWTWIVNLNSARLQWRTYFYYFRLAGLPVAAIDACNDDSQLRHRVRIAEFPSATTDRPWWNAEIRCFVHTSFRVASLILQAHLADCDGCKSQWLRQITALVPGKSHRVTQRVWSLVMKRTTGVTQWQTLTSAPVVHDRQCAVVITLSWLVISSFLQSHPSTVASRRVGRHTHEKISVAIRWSKPDHRQFLNLIFFNLGRRITAG